MRRAFAAVTSLAPAAAAAAEGSGVDTGALLRLTLGLAGVLALIVVLAWGMRRMGRFGSNAGGRLRVLGAVPVGQRERVVLLQAGERQLLIGVAPGSVRTLQVLDEPIAPVDGGGAPAQTGFAARLRGAMRDTEAS
ncbi:flagellar biosynthetic protein FliO [Arhodomonas sp. KWT2]|uniref:flagellar biosynthetic protein FliO n=1 Tax=Arhodomonas sp. KWT2 TaxID=3344194 RepID=UPI0035BF925B